MKKIFILLTAVLLIAAANIAPVTLSATFADDAVKRVMLANCDSMNGWSTAGAGLDDTTRVEGKFSYTVSSVWPNAKYNIDKTKVQGSGIAFEDAYFEFYIYVEDISKHTKSGYFKLSADYAYDDTDGKDVNETNIFKWGFSSIQILSGWNFFSLKISDMTYVGDETQKENVYNNLSKFYYVDPAKSIPGATGQIWETMYMLKVNLDAIAISDTYRSIAQEDIKVYSTVRYGDVEFSPGYFKREEEAASGGLGRTAETLIISGAAVVILGAAVGAMLLIAKRRKGK